MRGGSRDKRQRVESPWDGPSEQIMSIPKQLVDDALEFLELEEEGVDGGGARGFTSVGFEAECGFIMGNVSETLLEEYNGLTVTPPMDVTLPDDCEFKITPDMSPDFNDCKIYSAGAMSNSDRGLFQTLASRSLTPIDVTHGPGRLSNEKVIEVFKTLKDNSETPGIIFQFHDFNTEFHDTYQDGTRPLQSFRSFQEIITSIVTPVGGRLHLYVIHFSDKDKLQGEGNHLSMPICINERSPGKYYVVFNPRALYKTDDVIKVTNHPGGQVINAKMGTRAWSVPDILNNSNYQMTFGCMTEHLEENVLNLELCRMMALGGLTDSGGDEVTMNIRHSLQWRIMQRIKSMIEIWSPPHPFASAVIIYNLCEERKSMGPLQREHYTGQSLKYNQLNLRSYGNSQEYMGTPLYNHVISHLCNNYGIEGGGTQISRDQHTRFSEKPSDMVYVEWRWFTLLFKNKTRGNFNYMKTLLRQPEIVGTTLVKDALNELHESGLLLHGDEDGPVIESELYKMSSFLTGKESMEGLGEKINDDDKYFTPVIKQQLLAKLQLDKPSILQKKGALQHFVDLDDDSLIDTYINNQIRLTEGPPSAPPELLLE